jgi:hypothetical protein
VTSDDLLVVFLDANILAKPVTRTLILRCVPAGHIVTWSQAAEDEADRHLSDRQMSVRDLRRVVEIALSRSGANP